MGELRAKGAIRYRDGKLVPRDVDDVDRRQLLRAGFRPHRLTLTLHDGSISGATLWMQDEPRLADFLNAANLIFGDEPGSLSW